MGCMPLAVTKEDCLVVQYFCDLAANRNSSHTAHIIKRKMVAKRENR